MNFTSSNTTIMKDFHTQKTTHLLRKSKLRRQIILHPRTHKQQRWFNLFSYGRECERKINLDWLFAYTFITTESPRVTRKQSQIILFNLSCDYFQLNPSQKKPRKRAFKEIFSFSFITGKIHYRKKISFKNIFLALG